MRVRKKIDNIFLVANGWSLSMAIIRIKTSLSFDLMIMDYLPRVEKGQWPKERGRTLSNNRESIVESEAL